METIGSKSYAKIVAISDTHMRHKSIIVPQCDILFHAGDFSTFGSRREFRAFAEWFAKQDAKYKVLICGNHDTAGQTYPDLVKTTCAKLGITYLNEESATIMGLKIFGTPWSIRFGPWAFMADRDGLFLKEKWDKIPSDTDILLVHGPMYGYGDANTSGFLCGCKMLLERVRQIKPKLVINGHIHEKYGVCYTDFGTCVVNAAQVDLFQRLVNKPIEIQIELSK
jgi:Icc-related predicted phosphoesterase